ncbi:hypothetical protein BMS3Bbin12_02242 [bacterium BMS3Bbin12]|nr:hypothetical protein BMS3Abin12_00728 [bacterium BMS3Abin12]GBE49049.1 hypothetical protein BMS3Bbin12_02242 [bacterium BMS3Bbin12]GBE51308.1 hypothetical protein BMS3Bbin13_02266 [bacterium BMS3Bbin13]
MVRAGAMDRVRAVAVEYRKMHATQGAGLVEGTLRIGSQGRRDPARRFFVER